MVLNIATFVGAVTPVAISTLISHYVPKRQESRLPTADISYDEGLALVRRFLIFASNNTVEELQDFTTQSVPILNRVKTKLVNIPEQHLTAAAQAIQLQLKPCGISQIGGKTWWQWRRPGTEMNAEWIETLDIYEQRKKDKQIGENVMFYVHGGGYFFGSVDVHRYQLQRHARKLKGRVFAPRYRLAPQFPFPCGLQDCLAAYLYLITVQTTNTIVLAGDSAGAGMILSMLVVMRDQGIPLPAGAILISPWVDLTHSFPSVGEEHPLDYIPACGFHHKPSKSWPPESREHTLPGIGCVASHETGGTILKKLHSDGNSALNIKDGKLPEDIIDNDINSAENTIPRSINNISIIIDGKPTEINDQIHMYAPNNLLTHPLVSPIFQPSLGGLPPLLILTGDGEMLRDEQIYLAHKAANPSKYSPADAFLDNSDKKLINQWTPTYVQLQIWEGLCHAAPTLSFTRPAKHMYRSVAQFATWALNISQGKGDHRLEHNNYTCIEVSKSDGQEKNRERDHHGSSRITSSNPFTHIGIAGDPLPPFNNFMIRQRVDCNGLITPLEPESALAACNLDPSQIGFPKEKLILQWLHVKRERDTKYAPLIRRIQRKREKDALKTCQIFEDDEVPPPTALAGRSIKNQVRGGKTRSFFATGLGTSWSNNYIKSLEMKFKDKKKKAESNADDPSGIRSPDHTQSQSQQAKSGQKQPKREIHGRLFRKIPVDTEPLSIELEENSATRKRLIASSKRPPSDAPVYDLSLPVNAPSDKNLVTMSQFHTESSSCSLPTATDADRKWPFANGIAYPFTLKDHPATTSMLTLISMNNNDSVTETQGSAHPLDKKSIPQIVIYKNLSEMRRHVQYLVTGSVALPLMISTGVFLLSMYLSCHCQDYSNGQNLKLLQNAV